jgi:hypothetical protein
MIELHTRKTQSNFIPSLNHHHSKLLGPPLSDHFYNHNTR